MTAVFMRLLHERDRLLSDVLGDTPLVLLSGSLVVLMVTAAAAYGSVLGIWHGARLAAYDAVKFPMVLLLTSAFTVVFSWIVARAFAVDLRFAQVIALTLVSLATASLVLCSLAPVALFLTLCAPPPSAATRTTHNALYLMHTAFVGACGVAGTRFLWTAMQRLRRPRGVMRRVYVSWVLVYALVGGEVAWALRPFVGSVSPQYPVTFLRRDALKGNVYEFIGTDIVPYLWSRSRH